VVEGGFAGYLTRSLRLLRDEAPAHFAATRAHLGPLAVRITVGNEAPVVVRLDGAEPWVRQHAPEETFPAAVDVGASRPALAAFLRGELSIEEAVTDDRLTLRGSLDHLLPFFDGLAAWLHGALRSPSFPSLHRQYLATIE
jgi:hypothetical protein